MRAFICCPICNRSRVEYDYIGKHSFFQKASMIEAEIGRRQPTESTDCFLKGDHFFFAHVLAQQTGEVPISTRMSRRSEEGAFGSHRGCVRAQGDPGLAKPLRYVLFAHHEIH